MLLSMLALGLFTTLAAPAANATTDCQRDLLTVEGQAEVRVKPDLVRIVMAAEQRAASLTQAEVAVKASTDAILALVRANGVAESDIDSSAYVLQPVYEWSGGKRLPKRLGFRVRQTLRVTLRDLARFGPLLSGIVDAGVVEVESVEPEIEQTRGHRDEARLLAIRAAREKAQAIVTELGQSLGRATTIEVDGASSASCCGASSERSWSANVTSNTLRNYASTDDTGPSYALGAITLTARVKVAFELK